MTSMKTTLAGICAIVAAVAGALYALIDGNPNTNPDWTLTMGSIMAGIGLIVARDNNVTSEQAGAKNKVEED